MRKHYLATTAFTLVGLTISPPGFAKTPHTLPPPQPPAEVYAWTGFYLGLNGGGAWGQSHVTQTVNCGTPPGTGYFCDSSGTGAANAAVLGAAGSGNINSSAFTGGIQAGYNYQWGRSVVGIETDFDSFHLSGTLRGNGIFPVAGPGGVLPAGTAFTIVNGVNTDWLWTFRGRIGWLAQPNLLAYVTGGAAVTSLAVSTNYSDNNGAMGSGSASATKTGWTIGGGLEWLLDNHWSVKGEFLYVDFGTVTANASVPAGAKATAISTISTKADLTAEIARLGVNYKF
jgi:outer membrane immunogenic protein